MLQRRPDRVAEQPDVTRELARRQDAEHEPQFGGPARPEPRQEEGGQEKRQETRGGG